MLRESEAASRPVSTQDSSSSSSSSIFRLEDQSSQWGIKLWTLTFDLPGEKVNVLNRKTMAAFDSVFADLEAKGSRGEIEALVLCSGKPGNFIAGADIEMLQATKSAQEAEALSRAGQKALSRWEDLPFPTVAAIDGAALGGGMEWSLASTAILMSTGNSARIGLPEVMLGIIPGTGGCVRLTRKVGLATALDLILTGKSLNAERAYRSGVIEAALPSPNFLESALRWTRSNLDALRAGKRLAKEPKLGGMGGTMGTLLEKTSVGRATVFKKARQGVLQKSRGHYPAPLEAIAVLQESGLSYGPRLKGEARDRAMDREAVGFGRVADTEVSKNLIRIFFLTEQVKKSNGLPPGTQVQAKPVKRSAVLGAGVMGGGIAQLFAEKSVSVRMKDLNTQALALGIQSAAKIFQKAVKRRKITSREMLQRLNRIAPVLDFSGFAATDLVVEAVIEKMDVKKKVFQELENHVSDQTVIASNTSSLSISEMQSVMKNPARFAGMHFFNPVHKMPLIEVIRGAQSSDEAVATVYEFSKKIGKTPIVVKDAPGFLVNRLLLPYLNEATWLLTEGVPIGEIDDALLKFGMPMGPMELIDEVGIDVGDKVAHILHDAFGSRAQPAPFNAKMVQAGRLGKKNGKGFYVYSEGGRKKELDPQVYEVLGMTPSPGAVSEQEIVERCILPMINEASRCLEEKVVMTASEVDLGMIMGTGFPPFRGGLLRYADSLGASQIVESLKRYQTRFGARYEPAPVLLTRAQHDQRFYS